MSNKFRIAQIVKNSRACIFIKSFTSSASFWESSYLSSPSKMRIQDGWQFLDSTSGGCPPSDPDKLDQLSMKLDHLQDKKTNLLLPLRENHSPHEGVRIGEAVETIGLKIWNCDYNFKFGPRFNVMASLPEDEGDHTISPSKHLSNMTCFQEDIAQRIKGTRGSGFKSTTNEVQEERDSFQTEIRHVDLICSAPVGQCVAVVIPVNSTWNQKAGQGPKISQFLVVTFHAAIHHFFLMEMEIDALGKLFTNRINIGLEILDIETELEQQSWTVVIVLPRKSPEPGAEVEAVLAETNVESMTRGKPVVEFDLRPSEWPGQFDKNDHPPQVTQLCSTAFIG
ncbi:hypothetical protein Tco_1009009, partial [Tanacetum coccineum]